VNERERQNNAARKFEIDIHDMQLRERDLTSDLRDKTALEERIEVMKKEIVTFTSRLKVSFKH
jgi:DNA repair protein RAD50